MGFNFGAFAGGVASGYEAATKLRIQQEEAENERKELLAKMAKEQKEALQKAKDGKTDNTLKKAEATMKYQKDLADATTAEEYAGLTNAYDTQMAAYDEKEKFYTDEITRLNPTPEQTTEVADAENVAVDQVVEKAVAENPELNQRVTSIRFDNKSYAGNTKATNFLKMRQKAPNWQETTRVNDKTYEIEVKDKDGKWQSAGFEPLRHFAPEADKDRSTEMERAHIAYNKRTGKNIPIEEFKQKHWSPKNGKQTIDVSTLPSKVQENIRKQLGSDTKFLPESVVNTYMTEDAPTTPSSAITKPRMVDIITALEVRKAEGEELGVADQIKLKNYKRYVETEGDVKRDLNVQAGEITDKYTTQDPHFKTVTQKDINKMVLFEKNAGFKVDATFAKEIIDGETTIFALDRLIKKLQPLKDDEAERGIVDSIKLKAQTLISDENWADLPEEEKRKHLLTIGINTSIGAALADYIKSISGTAVAEAEYNRLMNILTAGDYSNIQTLKEAIGMFTDDLKAKHFNKLKSNFLHKGSFVLNKIKQYNDKFGDSGKPIDQVSGYDVYDDGDGKGAYIWYNGKKKYTKKKGK